MSKPRACVFAYGDIGRSPRMQNHAQELSRTHEVYFMGYIDSSPRTSILDNPHIHLVDLEIGSLAKIKKISFVLYALVRVTLQILQILYLLGIRYRRFQFVLVQNPPSIPNLLAIWLASFVSSYKIYIDFHNYGYTILSMRIKNRIINSLACAYEKFFGKRQSKAFCVSNEMKQDLKHNWGIDAVTLYDRPRHNFLAKNKVDVSSFWKKYGLDEPSSDDLLVVSSTSWTKDQDFSILLNAVQKYDQSESKNKLRAFITGKGPQKEFYLNKINELKKNWQKVSVETVWLDADDYPTLLSLCHLGVCLHYSSSGLDLPMKVVDMFAAGIPVLAIEYRCIGELVKNKQNGYIFRDSIELCAQLQDLAENREKLGALKKGAELEKLNTWEVEWKAKFHL